jgi:hypothetical protein
VRHRGVLLAALLAGGVAAADRPAPLFSDGFERYAAGYLPGAPWKEEMYNSGAVIKVDDARVFSGRQALHVRTPANAIKRRGYLAIHLKGPLPQLQDEMFGRVMVWLDAAPDPAVQWTLLQGEGRSADDRYNAIYRLGLRGQDGLQLMANFETTPPVRTNCMQPSTRRLPVRRWACIEWHMAVASQESRFWIDGKEITHVKTRAAVPDSCQGDDLAGEWRAPPVFDSLYMGFERYGDTTNDQNLWMDDVVLAEHRIGCPKSK